MDNKAKCERLFDLLGGAHEYFVEEALPGSRQAKERLWARLIPLAACLTVAVIVTVFFAVNGFGKGHNIPSDTLGGEPTINTTETTTDAETTADDTTAPDTTAPDTTAPDTSEISEADAILERLRNPDPQSPFSFLTEQNITGEMYPDKAAYEEWSAGAAPGDLCPTELVAVSDQIEKYERTIRFSKTEDRIPFTYVYDDTGIDRLVLFLYNKDSQDVLGQAGYTGGIPLLVVCWTELGGFEGLCRALDEGIPFKVYVLHVVNISTDIWTYADTLASPELDSGAQVNISGHPAMENDTARVFGHVGAQFIWANMTSDAEHDIESTYGVYDRLMSHVFGSDFTPLTPEEVSPPETFTPPEPIDIDPEAILYKMRHPDPMSPFSLLTEENLTGDVNSDAYYNDPEASNYPPGGRLPAICVKEADKSLVGTVHKIRLSRDEDAILFAYTYDKKTGEERLALHIYYDNDSYSLFRYQSEYPWPDIGFHGGIPLLVVCETKLGGLEGLCRAIDQGKPFEIRILDVAYTYGHDFDAEMEVLYYDTSNIDIKKPPKIECPKEYVVGVVGHYVGWDSDVYADITTIIANDYGMPSAHGDEYYYDYWNFEYTFERFGLDYYIMFDFNESLPHLYSNDEKKIEKAYCEIYGYPAYEVDVIAYYGTFNDAFAVMIRDGGMYPAIEGDETVDGVTFDYYTASIKIRVFYGGQFYYLPEAFSMGLLDHDDLLEIARMHEIRFP